jgi:hypothetical protein
MKKALDCGEPENVIGLNQEMDLPKNVFHNS